jgi:hypothetical protein
MDEYFTEWFHNVMERPDIVLSQSISVRGECRRHTGPSYWYAAVTLIVEPGAQLQVEDMLAADLSQRIRELGWYDQIVFGVLDVFLTRPIEPIRAFKLTISDIEINEIESNAMALRIAARNAAENVLELRSKGS